MRILQISHRHHVAGGSDTVFMATCKLLRDAGHEVIPFCLDHPENLPSRWSGYFPKGADTATAPLQHVFRYFFNSEARAKLEQLLDDVGPVDVAHLHIYHGKHTPSILRILRRHQIPVVHSLHEYKLACPTYTMERDGEPCELCVGGHVGHCLRHRCKDGSLLRSAVMAAEMLSSRLLGDVRLVDRFLCVSEFQRQVMKRAGLPVQKLATLHNFLEVPETMPQNGHRGYFLYFGRIEKLKGLRTLLDAFDGAPHRLIIAGDGSWCDEMVACIRSAPNIEYRGFQSGRALTELIAGARAVIVPSLWYENCPMSVLEAKAQGRPVLGADTGGIPELIHDGRDGYLFSPGNPQSLREALKKLGSSDHAAFARAAWLDARERFSAANYLANLTRHYDTLCQTPAPVGLHLHEGAMTH